MWVVEDGVLTGYDRVGADRSFTTGARDTFPARRGSDVARRS